MTTPHANALFFIGLLAHQAQQTADALAANRDRLTAAGVPGLLADAAELERLAREAENALFIYLQKTPLPNPERTDVLHALLLIGGIHDGVHETEAAA